jgi:hypothetical protein
MDGERRPESMAEQGDALDKARKLLEARADELRTELTDVERGLAALPKGSSKRAQGKGSVGGRNSTAKGARSGQPGGTRRGARTEEAVQLIAKRPGITLNELASEMKLKGPHYLYRLLPRLEKQGRVRKAGDGYKVV